MKIAYCSPFNPIKSGISDFSEELIMVLKKYAEIDIFYNRPPTNKDIVNNFKFFDIKEIYKEGVSSRYDICVYHMGNNVDYHKCIKEAFLRNPGILELHDFSLHNYLAGETYVHNDIDGYLECVKYCHGDSGVKIVQKFLDGKARAPWETHALELTVNKHLIDVAKGVIVHSDMAKQMVKGIRPDVPVINIPLHTPDIIEDYNQNKIVAKKKLNIDEQIMVLGSFGYATRAKRILEILEALSLYKKRNKRKFHYFIVGKVDGIDIDSKLKELSLEDNVTVTGFTEIEDFKLYMSACDICMNLRYPTHGESSASLHRMLGMGKPVIVSKIGSFEEYPDNIVLKVRCDENEVRDIYNAIIELTSRKNIIVERSKLAYEYAKENCSLIKNAKRYFEFFNSITQNNFQDNSIDTFLDKVFELGLEDEEYIKYLLHEKQLIGLCMMI